MVKMGIDLGITNSAFAYENPTEMDMVLNRKPDISIGSSDLLIGSQAVDNAERNPENTIFSIKRQMGRYYDDPNVRECSDDTNTAW